MITTLFRAASTTTSSHSRGQHDQSPAPQRVRGGREGEGGHDNEGEGGGRPMADRNRREVSLAVL